MKQTLLAEISSEMNVASDEICAKIHALRTQFNREKSKENQSKSGAGTDELYTSKWEFYSSLKFLNVGTMAGDTISVCFVIHFCDIHIFSNETKNVQKIQYYISYNYYNYYISFDSCIEFTSGAR